MRVVNMILFRFANDLASLDNYDATTDIDFKQHKRLGKLFEFIKECKINAHVVHKNKEKIFGDLDGEECMRLIKNVKLGKFGRCYDSNSDTISDPNAEDRVNYKITEGTFINLFNTTKNPDLYVDPEHLFKVEMLWEEFHNIYELIILNEITPNNLETYSNQWIDMHNCLYFGDCVSPYMHLFSGHFREIFEKYGNLHLFNLQSKQILFIVQLFKKYIL